MKTAKLVNEYALCLGLDFDTLSVSKVDLKLILRRPHLVAYSLPHSNINRNKNDASMSQTGIMLAIWNAKHKYFGAGRFLE